MALENIRNVYVRRTLTVLLAVPGYLANVFLSGALGIAEGHGVITAAIVSAWKGPKK